MNMRRRGRRLRCRPGCHGISSYPLKIPNRKTLFYGQRRKAFLLDTADSMVVLPFSGWNNNTYQNGLQLIEFTPTTLASEAGRTVARLQREVGERYPVIKRLFVDANE